MTNLSYGSFGKAYFSCGTLLMQHMPQRPNRSFQRIGDNVLRTTAFLFLVGWHPVLHAQQNIGMASGNYAGISGAWLNPASIVDSRYKVDMAVFGYESYFTNNFLLVKNRTMLTRLLRQEPYNGSFDAVKQDLLTLVNDMDGKVHASSLSEIQFPFSFMANLGERSAIALNIRTRTSTSMEGLDPATARMLYDNLLNPDLMGVEQDNGGYRLNFMNWMEFGFTYGRVLVKSDHHFLKGAFTAKLLAGGAAAYMASDDLKITFEDTSVVSIHSPLIEYGRTERADIDTYQRRNLLNGVEDYAIGWDLGLVYELRGNVSKSRFVDLDNVEKERPDKNKYIVRVGLSLLDVGKFTFERRELTQDHSANITGWDISQVNASDFDQFDTAYSELVDYVADGSPTFSYRLPAAVAGNIDFHLFGGFYLNAGGYADATSWFNEASTTLHAPEWVAVTPRFESRAFGLYIPVSQNDEKLRIGATVRIGPFFFGSNNLADQLINEQNTQADYHFGVRFSIGQGKPTALKRKFEAFRKQQEGISRNSTRIDSLEREVYALKMVMSDTVHGVRVVNNYYGGTATDTAAQRLQEENDDLLHELALANLRAQQDSLVLDRVANGSTPPEDAAKEARKSRKAAEGNTDAAEDMAKEMKRQRKAMQTQNAILAAGATAGIVAVASDGDRKRAAVDSVAVMLNDSMIVVNGDTLPLLIPPALDSMRSVRSIADTVWIVERDTVRVERTVRDTVTVHEAAIINTAVPKALVAPVYFATSRTDPGPEATDRLRDLADWLKTHPEARVTLTGVADASGAASVNQVVAGKRAASVRAILLQAGVPAARITTDSRIAPVEGKPDPSDRRTEILVTP